MPNLNDIIWAANIFRALYYNSSYTRVLRSETFINSLRRSPQDLETNDVKTILLQFLNDWKCRLKYDDTTATNLKNCIVEVHPELFNIQNFSILDFDFENITNREIIENIFNRFWEYDIARNYGPTCISKTLHIINPNLFVMWDKKIRLHYWAQNNNITESGRGYYIFLIDIKSIAEQLIDECIERYNNNNPALFISNNLNIDLPLTLAKFIDEFNYLFYTRESRRAQDWTSPF